jgi:hypothetical protein
VQRRGEQVVELVQVARGRRRSRSNRPGCCASLAQRLGLHGAQEHAGVDLPVEAAPDGVAAGRQVERRANRGHACTVRAGLFARSAAQRISALPPSEMPDRQQRATAARLLHGVKALQHPADLGKVAASGRRAAPG